MQPIVCVCSACARLAQLLSNAPVTAWNTCTSTGCVFWLRCSLRIISQKVKHANRKFAYPANNINRLNVYLDVHSQNISMPFVLHQWHVTQVWLKDILVIYGYERVCLTLLHLCTRLSAAHLNCKLGIDFFFFCS